MARTTCWLHRKPSSSNSHQRAHLSQYRPYFQTRFHGMILAFLDGTYVYTRTSPKLTDTHIKGMYHAWPPSILRNKETETSDTLGDVIGWIFLCASYPHHSMHWSPNAKVKVFGDGPFRFREDHEKEQRWPILTGVLHKDKVKSQHPFTLSRADTARHLQNWERVNHTHTHTHTF